MRRIAFIKHGDVLGEYETICGLRQWTMADSTRPYIVEMIDSLEKREALFIGLDENRSSTRAGRLWFEVLPVERPVSKSVRLFNLLFYNLKIFRMLLFFKPKLIVVSGNFFNAFFPYLVSLLNGSKLILILTGKLPESGERLRMFVTSLYKKLVKSKKIFAILSRGKFPLTQLDLPPETPNIFDIYPVYDFEIFENAKCSIDFDKDFEMLFVGRLSGEKGVMDFMPILKAMDGNVRLTVVGDGPLRQELKEKLEVNGLSDKVRFMGFKAPTELYGFMKMADILIVPSRSESLCKVTIEGLFAGLPIVANDVGGIAANMDIDKTGFLVPSGAVEEFISKINILRASKTKRQEMSKNSIVKAKKDFSGKPLLADILKKLYLLYENPDS